MDRSIDRAVARQASGALRGAAVGLLLLAACVTPGGGTVSGDSAIETLPVMVKRALPAVVLIIAEREDGSRGYGAGTWVDAESSKIITALHVVDGARRLLVMPYRTGRQSYLPMDGGLDRFLFENEGQLRPAQVLRSDRVTDLSVIEVRGPLLPHAVLPRGPEVHAGEKVLALGHAQETVWSFTSGVVSALHSEAIQHDAALNPGSSGGPLINEQGQLVGINTLRAVGGADGVGFARPITLAEGLAARSLESTVVELGTVRDAARTCFRAQELGSVEVAHCFDWSLRWDLLQRAVDDLCERLALDAVARKAFRKELARLGDRQWWTDRIQERTLWWMRGEPSRGETGSKTPRPKLPGVPEAKAAAVAGWRSLAQEMKEGFASEMERRRKDNGLQASLAHNAEMQETLKKGLRVEEVVDLPDAHAWVLLQGRNLDGSPYRLSEYWGEEGGAWRQHSPPPASSLATLPEGWPPAVDSEAMAILREQLTLIQVIAPELGPEIKKEMKVSDEPGS